MSQSFSIAMHIKVKRTYPHPKYIIGDVYVNEKWLCNSLEPSSWRFPYPCAPSGTYEVKMLWSQKFYGDRPFLLAVPKRSGIMIHEGNSLDDTRGCILLGRNSVRGKVLHSRVHVQKIMQMIRECEARSERVFITLED